MKPGAMASGLTTPRVMAPHEMASAGDGDGLASTGLVIVVPVLDEAASLAECLIALRPLRARGTRVVVADGGSSDDSCEIAALHADLVVQAPRGRGSQMNAGAGANSDATAAATEVLLFLHADTRLPDDADRLALDAIRSGSAWGRFDVRIASARWPLRGVEAMMNWRSRATGIATGDQAMFVGAAAFAAVGGFDDIALMEDIAISRRLKRLGPPACLRARVTTSARRWERFGIWRTVWLMWRLRAAYFFGADPARLARRYGHRPRG